MWLIPAWTRWAPSPLSFLSVCSFRLWKPTWHPRTVTGSMQMRWGQTQTRTNAEESSLWLCHLNFPLFLVCFPSLCSVWAKWAFIQYFITVFIWWVSCILSSHDTDLSDPNCTNEEIDELSLLADHFLLLLVDINPISHSNLLIFLD